MKFFRFLPFIVSLGLTAGFAPCQSSRAADLVWHGVGTALDDELASLWHGSAFTIYTGQARPSRRVNGNLWQSLPTTHRLQQPRDMGESLVVDDGDNYSVDSFNHSSAFFDSITVGYDTSGSFSQSGGMVNAGQLVLGQNAGSSGSYMMSAGNLQTGDFFLGVDGSGTMTQNGGSVMVSGTFFLGYSSGSSGSYSLGGFSSGTGGFTALSTGLAYVGGNGTGSFFQYSGSFNTGGQSLLVGGGAGGNGTYVMLGGTLATGSTYVSDDANTSVFYQYGGVHTTGQLILTGFSTNSTGTYTLQSGSLVTGGISSGDGDATTGGIVQGTSTFNFNGGTLRAGADNAAFMEGLTTANVQANGAIIDTDNTDGGNNTHSYNITINQPLVHDAALGSNADGGLTKNGYGSLTLGGVNTYTGPTTLNGGTLTFAAGSSLAAGGNVTINAGTLNVNGTLNVGTLMAGNYTSTGTPYVSLSDGASLTTSYEFLGYTSSNAFFMQSGGTHTTGSLTVGYNYGANASYTLSGATSTLTAGSESIGGSGFGSFNQQAGTNTVNGTLSLGQNSQSNGIYTLYGGTLSASMEFISNGTFTQSGGINVAGGISLFGSSLAEYNLAGGTLRTGSIYGSNGGSFFDFAGGTLQATADSAANTPPGVISGRIYAGKAAIIDTNGHHFILGMSLAPYTYNGSGSDGGLTKNGAGELTFAGQGATFSYYGPTYLNAGTLTFDVNTTFQGGSNFTLGTGTTLNFKGAYTGGGSYTVGAGATLNFLGSVNNPNSPIIAVSLNGTSAQPAVSNINSSSLGTLSLGYAYVGNTGVGAFNQNGASVSMLTLDLGGSAGGSGTYTLGNQVSAALTASTEYVGDNGTGVFNQNGGLHSVYNTLYLGYGSGSQGTYTLSGGTLQTYGIQGGSGTSTFNFNGGLLRTSGGNLTVQGLSALNVQAGGAHVQADNNFTITLAQGLRHDPALGATEDGGLTKDGPGTLILGGASAYTGLTNLTGGTLNVPTGASLTAGAIQLYAATLNITGQVNFGDSTAFNGLGLGGSEAVPAVVAIQQGGQLGGDNEYIGETGYGNVTQSGGTHTVTGAIYLGDGTNGVGTYTLGGDNSYLHASQEYVAFSGRGTFTQNGGINLVDSFFTVGGGYGGSGSYILNGGSFSAPNQIIGTGGSGSFTQNGGGNSFGTLTIGDAPSSYLGGYGTYFLGGDSGVTLQGGIEYVGASAYGSFEQSGGRNLLSTNTAGSGLYLGYGTGGTGSYVLDGANALLSAGYEYSGYDGQGYFTQSSGRNDAYYLYLGYHAGGKGNYDLSGADSLVDSITQYVGYSGTGTFTHSAGEGTANVLYVGYNSGSTGTYGLSGTGYRYGLTQYIGYTGTGTFTQTGGSNTVDNSTNAPDPLYGAMFLGYNAGGNGTYNLSGTGATLSALNEYVGYDGSGTFTQSGGTNTVSRALVLGNGSGGSGTYTLSGGTLQAAGVAGGSGASTFNFNGGTLEATVNNSAWMGGLAAANIQTGGAVIDTQSFNVTISQTLAHDPALSSMTADGGLTKAGAGTLALTGASTYNGGTTVTAGTLLANNAAGSATGTGSVTVNGSSAVLGGTGTINGPVSVTNGGINPGGNGGANGSAANVGTLTVGTLTLNSMATATFDVNSATLYDQLMAIGNVDLSGSGLTLNFNGGITFTPGQVLDLVHTTGQLSGTFAGITNGGQYNYGGNLFTAMYTPTDFELVAGAVPVPEPATWVAGALTAWLGASAWRRRTTRRAIA